VALNGDLLDEELGLLATAALDTQRGERSHILEYHAADERVGALADAEDVFQPALLQGSDGRRRDHAAVGDDADRSMPKRERRRSMTGINTVTSAVLPATSPSRSCHQVGPVILGIAPLAQRLATGSGE
jgi:hypothetical protein